MPRRPLQSSVRLTSPRMPEEPTGAAPVTTAKVTGIAAQQATVLVHLAAQLPKSSIQATIHLTLRLVLTRLTPKLELTRPALAVKTASCSRSQPSMVSSPFSLAMTRLRMPSVSTPTSPPTSNTTICTGALAQGVSPLKLMTTTCMSSRANQPTHQSGITQMSSSADPTTPRTPETPSSRVAPPTTCSGERLLLPSVGLQSIVPTLQEDHSPCIWTKIAKSTSRSKLSS